MVLSKAIKNNDITKNTVNVKCLFHFSQMIRKQLTKSGICKIKFNKYTLEIIRNIEIMCFLKRYNIKKQQNIIIDKLISNDKLKTFVKYLKNYLFKLDYSLFNYEEFMNNFDFNTDTNIYGKNLFY